MISTGDQEVHLPVMVEEVVRHLSCGPHDDVLDCTVGGGGHAEAILEATAPDGRLFGIDRDGEMLPYAKKRLERFGDRVILRQGRFDQILTLFPRLGPVNGVLFDLGVSSLQLDRAERGFSFAQIGPLDMRMDRTTGESAADLLARLPESELIRILKTYGEERFARRIARSIVRARGRAPLTRTDELEDLVYRSVPPSCRHGRIHPATRTFQALRIVVNQELELLEKGLVQGVEALAHGGRICVITFHSLEDRMVKHFFRGQEREEGRLKVRFKKPLLPRSEEVHANPRARSAKMRVGERT
jgi:16S rRNA (cytosine1402-N4)-methyltransferase